MIQVMNQMKIKQKYIVLIKNFLKIMKKINNKIMIIVDK